MILTELLPPDWAKMDVMTHLKPVLPTVFDVSDSEGSEDAPAGTRPNQSLNDFLILVFLLYLRILKMWTGSTSKLFSVIFNLE